MHHLAGWMTVVFIARLGVMMNEDDEYHKECNE